MSALLVAKIQAALAQHVARETTETYEHASVALTDSAALHRYVAPLFEGLATELGVAIVVDARLRPIGPPLLFDDSLPACVALPPRELVRLVLERNAAGLMVAHNHPTGDITPSKEDRAVSAKLASLGTDLGFRFLDSLVVAGERAYSITMNCEVMP